MQKHNTAKQNHIDAYEWHKTIANSLEALTYKTLILWSKMCVCEIT